MKNTKQRRVDFNRSEILNAAKELFSTKGAAATTVDDIARKAEYSKATIYVYFKSKDDIYYSIVSEYMQMLHDEIIRCFSDTEDCEGAYFRLCNSLVRFEREYPMYFDCILGNIAVSKGKMAELPVLGSIADTGEEINSAVCDFIEKGKREGFIREDVNPLRATFVMWSGICGIISLASRKTEYLEKRLGIDMDEYLRESFATLLRMIRKDDTAGEGSV